MGNIGDNSVNHITKHDININDTQSYQRMTVSEIR